jgi:D-alanyl-D-alanine carboxypeptidase (penicillin-binding protein 5/6)
VGGPLLAGRGVVAPRGAPALPAHLTARSWLVADLDSGAVLAARDPHGRYLPASTLKTLTALTLLPRLTDPDAVVTASLADADVDGTRVGLVPRGRYPVRTLFQCMLMMSGNDCADALAEANGGLPRTLAEMNAVARWLHAEDTYAATPSGLDGPGQATSAYDLALILRQAVRIPDFRRYNTTRRSVVPAQPPKYGRYAFANDNRLLWNYPGVLAAKNGYTDAARHTFVAAVQTPGRRLLVTMMHGEQRPVPMWQQVARLAQWGARLPRTLAPVGELVAPGGTLPGSTEPPPATGGPLTTASHTGVPWLPIGIGVGVVGLAAAFILARRRSY